ncbi:hypothetical protein NCAST_19_01130 [Nocardia asteroides NBRC 15531]|uniref:Uncharacterized protein n=2 Tax=Nocardia asteroides TaxID=1824 RepID=U5EAF2_NOCAS|nr:hypothetical protein NCAST_19_01130 [Nocardia asteroides NBRC 15531]
MHHDYLAGVEPMSVEDYPIYFDAPSTGHDYQVLPDGRVPLWVMLTVGDDAHCVTPWHSYTAPLVLSATVMGRDCDIPAGEVIGREFTASGGLDEALHDFRLVHDPRL